MAEIGFDKVLELVSALGIPGLVLFLWYLSDRSYQKLLQGYREDQLNRDAQINQAISEVRGMYEHNAELVKITQRLALDQKDLLLMNTQALTKVCEKIEQNQYCPAVRLEKRAKGMQE